MSEPRRLLLNPNNKTKGFVLWDNGTMTAFGGQTGFSSTPFWESYTPTPYGGVVRGACIGDWESTPGGYMVDWDGGVYNLGDATTPPGQPPGKPFGNYHVVADIVTDPSDNGQGYILTNSNQVIAFGGAPDVPQPPFLSLGSDGSGQFARRLVMDYASKKYYTLGSYGSVYHVNGAAQISKIMGVDRFPGGWLDVVYSWCWPYWHAAVDLVITDFSQGRGYIMDLWAGTHAMNDAQDFFGGPYTKDFAAWRGLALVDDGTGDNPLELAWLDIYGYVQYHKASTAPSCTVQVPTNGSTITDFTRPTVGWAYSDPENDAQKAALVRVFSAAQYGAVGFNADNSAATWETTVTGKGVAFVVISTDLANGAWRAYVKVQDTSDLWSAWSFTQWTQNVVRPATPTLTMTVISSATGIQALVHIPTPVPAGTKMGVQYKDSSSDPWRWVRNGDALIADGSGNATVIDPEAKFGVTRSYRALAYIVPGNDQVNAGDWSQTKVATLTDKSKYLMTNPTDSNQGGVVTLQDFIYNRTVLAGSFSPTGRRNAVVVSDGAPKGISATLKCWAPDGTTRARLESMIEAATTLYLRDPYGQGFYVRPVKDIEWERHRAAKLVSESTPTRDLHVISIPVVEVDRPLAGPTTGPLAILV